MRINNLGYLIKEGIRSIFLRGFMSFAAVCVTVACLLIVGSFSCLTYNVNLMVEDLNKTNEILVYVDSSLSDAEARSVGTRINMLDNVLNSKFVSREEALANFVADHEGDDAFTGVDASDLRHRFVVTLEDNTRIEQTGEALRAVSGVADIRAEYELAEGFSTLQQILEIASMAVISVLLVVSLLIISNTVKLAMYDALVTKINAVDTLQLFSFVPFQELLIPMVVVFLGAGMFVGIIGSWTSIRKFMNV